MMKILRCLCGFLIATTCVSCVATSKMGEAVVTDVDGLPCFSVPLSSISQEGVPLDALGVTRKKSPRDVGYPKDVWYFRIMPPGKTILIHPKKCIQYGKIPESAEQEEFEPLLSYQVYSVFMHAVPDGTEIQGYRAEFCLINSKGEERKVLVVPWDATARRWRYEVCAKPE